EYPHDPVFGQKLAALSVRHLKRWPLKTPYPEIVAEVTDLLDRPPLPGSPLLVDATGVGRAVVDLFRQAVVDKPRRAGTTVHLVPVTSTAGFAVGREAGGFTVPKRDLAGVMQVLMGERRLKVADVPEREALLKELQNFKVKVKASTGNETLEAWRERDHDDLV